MVKHLAAIAALAASFAATPSIAQDFRAPMTTFYVEVPLDAKSVREQTPAFGLQIQGRQEYQAFRLDTKMLDAYSRSNFLPAVIAGIEAKWIVAGAVAATAAIAATRKDKSTSQSMQQQQQQQLEACPEVCAPK